VSFRGCVSPKQIQTIIDQLGGIEDYDLENDLDVLDGWDELPDWAHDKIREAIRNGHVDDEDWKGVRHPLPYSGLPLTCNRTQN